MCLVEIEKAPKLQIACNTRVTDGMVVHTQSEKTQDGAAARCSSSCCINHPIDCPICDQAGECKLQEYYMDYDRQREPRRRSPDKVHKRKAIADRAARHARPGALHPLLALHPLPRRGHEDRRARRSSSAATTARSTLAPGQDARQPVLRQRRRHLSGRGAHQPRLPLPRPRLVPRAHRRRSARAAPTAATSSSTIARGEIFRFRPRAQPRREPVLDVRRGPA